MITIKQVNAELRRLGWMAEIGKSHDCFYVYGDSVKYAYSTLIPVFRLNQLTLEQWVEEVKIIAMNSTSAEEFV